MAQHILQSIMEMVQNVRSVSTDILCIYELTLTLLQFGANPNFILSKQVSGSMSAVSEALGSGANQMRHLTTASVTDSSLNNDSMRNSFRNNTRNYILFYYIMLITRKEFILTNQDRDYTKIVYLFYYTMRHDVLFSCLKSLHNLFIVQVPNKSTEHLVNLISQLYRNPRSLKQICRVSIYESLNRKLANNINRLNLPLSIKEYVLNFEQ